MAKLKVPSLQHLARLWHADPKAIQRTLVNLTKSGPTFSYAPLFDAVRDMLVLDVPYDQILESARRCKREDVRQNFLGLLPLIHEYFEGVSASFVQGVAPRYYPVGRDLMVPFQPPLIYGANGQIHFPWLSFWRGNPLAGERLSLFVTIVEEVLLQDADLEEAKFIILDFSAPNSKSERELKVIEAASVPRVSETRKVEMLAAFAEGFHLAQSDQTIASRVEMGQRPDEEDRNQSGLFDDH
jgi:hypothetical protein